MVSLMRLSSPASALGNHRAGTVGHPDAVRFAVLRVDGPSMLPTLAPRDLLLVRWGGDVRPGALVVARPLARPGLRVVKRARLDLGDGDWDVGADNPEVAGRGWTSGPATVLGTVVARWPPRRKVRSQDRFV